MINFQAEFVDPDRSFVEKLQKNRKWHRKYGPLFLTISVAIAGVCIWFIIKLQELAEEPSLLNGDAVIAGLVFGGILGFMTIGAVGTAVRSFVDLFFDKKMNRMEHLLLKYYDLYHGNAGEGKEI